MASNPCIRCGACCAFFRASFYWAETDASPYGTVPAELTEKRNDFLVSMRGTSGPSPRCVALEGTIGECVSCAIYERRPSPCREFEYSWENGARNERCDRARAAWGLPPLVPVRVSEEPSGLRVSKEAPSVQPSRGE